MKIKHVKIKENPPKMLMKLICSSKFKEIS